METRRQKFVPDLETGILDPEPGVPWADQVAGKLMVQPEVYAPDGTKRLLDDFVPMEWLYITAGLEEQRWMDGLEDAWRSIGGCRIVILPSDGALPSKEASDAPSRPPSSIELFHETDGRFDDWCNRTGFYDLLVRPDRYVYATADPANLPATIRRMMKRLGSR